MEFFAIFLIFGMASFGLRVGAQTPPNVFNVKNFGAVGDGNIDDSKAFLMGWEAMCASTQPMATLIIPEGTFLIQIVKFSGPCKSTTPNFQINGTIVAPNTTTWSEASTPWIGFSQVNGLIVNGNGQINGMGSAWWKQFENSDKRPTALHFTHCNNLQINGLTHIDSQQNHISINKCNGVSISNLQIRAPENSPNTDGIDISNSTGVDIHDCFMGTGDDCVAINTGSSNISIANVNCGPGHGISVGSLGKDGTYATVENVIVKNCIFNGTQNGARIKTWQGGSGYARNILFENINFINAGNPILINQYYCLYDKCDNKTSAVKISNVAFINMLGTSKDETAINLSCSESVPCNDIVLNGINITSASPTIKTDAYCINAYGQHENTVPPLNNCLLA